MSGELLQQIKEYGEWIGWAFGALVSVAAASKQGRTWFKAKWSEHKKSREAKRNMPSLVSKIHDNVNKLDVRLSAVEKEMKPNGGGSMKDQLRLIKAEMDANNWLLGRPTFRTTSSGINVYVNESYCNLCGCGSDELMKLGWKNFVQDQDQGDEFYERWILAAKTLSQFVGKLKMQTTAGEYRGEWLIRIRPLGQIESTGVPDDYLWHGTLYASDDKAKEYARNYGIPN